MTGPLEGIRVLELAGKGAAPFAGMMLGDMGADVMVVDRPDSVSTTRDNTDLMRRNKRVRRLDLKQAPNVATFLEWAADADVLIEGYRPGVMERLGLGPEVLADVNSKLVYTRVTGWGQYGPLAAKAGHDINYISLTGALHAIGVAGMPPVPPLSLVGDFGGGGMVAAFGIVSALLERVGSGRGQVVDAAMFDGAATLMASTYGMRQRGEWNLDRSSNRTDGAAPFYRTFATADRKYIAVGALEDEFFSSLIEVLGVSGELNECARSPEDWPRIERIFERVFASRTRDEWVDAFSASDACLTPVVTMEEAWDGAHAKARGTFVEVNGVIHPAPSPRLSRTAGSIRIAPGDKLDIDRPWF